jgi:hypothetical protein
MGTQSGLVSFYISSLHQGMVGPCGGECADTQLKVEIHLATLLKVTVLKSQLKFIDPIETR